MKKTIIVSAYLSGKGQEKKITYFERLDEYLRQFNYKLYLVNVGHDFIKTKVEHISIPKGIHNANRLRGCRYLKEDELAPELIKAAGVEAEIRNSLLTVAAVKVILFRAFMRKIFIERKSYLCIIWHQFNGLHRGLASLCKDMEIPIVYAEYGSMPGTIVLEHEGQMAESWIVSHNNEFLALLIDEQDTVRAESFLKNVRQQKLTRKDQDSDLSIDEIIKPYSEKGQKIVFYAGQNDPQTGMLPTWMPESKLHSPIFSDTFDALKHLASLAKKHDWQILFKPHPMLQEKYKKINVMCPERVDFVIGANIFECILKSDVIVTIVSQVSYLALIHDRPSVLLGRNQLSGKGCAYEAVTLPDVEQVLCLALEEGFSDERKKNWIKHVTQLCKYYLLSFNQDIEKLIKRGPDVAARYLISKCTKPVPVNHVVREARHSQTDIFDNDLKSGWGTFKLKWIYHIIVFFDIPIRQMAKENTTKVTRTIFFFVKELIHKLWKRKEPIQIRKTEIRRRNG